MYGTRFGGGGASGGWRGSTGRSGWRPRSSGFNRGRRFNRGGARTRGGNVSFLSSIAITMGTAEATAILAYIPFIHAGYWLDRQSRTVSEVQVDEWEGSLEAVRVVHGQWHIMVWPTNYTVTPDVQLLIPYHVGLAIVPAYDAGGVGDPNDFAPTALPNYFVRDWGHVSRSQPTSPDTTTYAGPAESAQRTLFRDAGFADCSDISLGFNRQAVQHHRAITKPFTLRRHDMFGLVLNAYNTDPDETMTLGFRVTGHFGYRRLRRAE